MITEERAKDICMRYYDTEDDYWIGECFNGYGYGCSICEVAILSGGVTLFKNYADMFERYVMWQIMEDFSDYMSFTDIEEYLGEDNYDWFVHEYADMLKVYA